MCVDFIVLGLQGLHNWGIYRTLFWGCPVDRSMGTS